MAEGQTRFPHLAAPLALSASNTGVNFQTTSFNYWFVLCALASHLLTPPPPPPPPSLSSPSASSLLPPLHLNPTALAVAGTAQAPSAAAS